MSATPATEYATRLDRRRASHDALNGLDRRLAILRLAVFASGIVAAVLGWREVLSAWWLAVPATAFLALIVWHDRVLRARARAAAAIRFYEHGVARVEDRWTGLGADGASFRDDSHPYATDLDLFGRGSLFQLLSAAKTSAGEATTASWLKIPAHPDEIATRQEALRELAPRLDFREEVAIDTPGLAGLALAAEDLVRWAEAPSRVSGRTRVAAAAVTAATLAVAALMPWIGHTPLLVMLGVQAGFALPLERRVRSILHGADGPARSLTAMAATMARLEREPFTSPRLQGIGRVLHGRHQRASTAVTRLTRLVEMHDWQHNVIFAPVALFLMWGTHLAAAVESWRRTHGPHVAPWLAAVGEFEALASLAGYAYEHPADPFPTVRHADIDGAASAQFSATGLGHPLLPASQVVRNDVSLADGVQLLLISGSNMSGKSTLLRTVGVNAVLAQAGAPVRATALTMSPLRVGATLRIQDSLQEGRSRFYAEITRVRELADLARGADPVLFLLDELFHGTNSHDRLAGATGVLRSLLSRGAVGLVTTHDLALTSVVDQLGGAARNVHFEDWFEGGEMRFDYRMKPGPVTRSNALALMRAVGLDVDGTGS